MAVQPSLTDARPVPFWTDRSERPAAVEALSGRTTADLVIIGAGFTGLWAAIEQAQRTPGDSIVILDAHEVGFGASGRNGGFISESLTHGIAHGLALWPHDMPMLLRMGRQNLDEIEQFVTAHGIDAGLRRCGKTAAATQPHEVTALAESHRLHAQWGEDVTLLDRDEVQADVHSPTFLAGLRVRSGGGLVDPARLAWGLKATALRMGITLHENSAVTSVHADGSGVRVSTATGSIHARRVLLATNAYRPLVPGLRSRILPIYDHVLMTEPLTADQLHSIGWRESQGLTDVGNQFHYYRRTDDDRILWGGYDAIYYFGNRTDAAREQRDSSHDLLARQFFETFPQLAGLKFTHRWAGLIDSTSRFTPVFGTTMNGRIAYAVGFTGLGVAASRFGAQTALDLLAGDDTERTRLDLVRRKPIAFPPEPLRYPTVQVTRAALAREDRTGRRGIWLRLLDRFGVGFNS